MKRLLPLSLLLLAGCAKFPGTTVAGSTRLVFTMTVDGTIRDNYVYIIALRPSLEGNPTTPGPEPVVAPPWGNGFVAGNVTHFVRYDVTQSPRYLLYKFRDVNLNEYFAIGAPVTSEDPSTNGGKTLRFELDLKDIEPTPGSAGTLQSLQVNFLTMDRVPQGNDTGGKNFDALGNSQSPSEINEWVTIPLTQNGIYDNLRFNGLEPRGDTRDPDLDITNFSVEVRKG